MSHPFACNIPVDRPLAWILILSAVAVHATALYDPIFSGDSALYAVIAKSFVTSGDWLNIYVSGTDWLDKPHFPFWLEAASMQLLGITAFAYKLPSLLLFLVGLIYTYRLAKDLYDPNIALLAVLILVTALHLFVSNNDVRAEAILIGLIMGGVYHFYRSATGGAIWHIVVGAVFCAAAVMTKGPFVVILFVSSMAAFLVHKGRFRDLFSLRWVLAAVLVAVFILPELIALYRQFDMHPEKVILGKTNVSGLWYFFWETQFGRFFNNGPFRGSGSPAFFVHSLLWAFVPWALIGYAALAAWLTERRKASAGERNPEFRYVCRDVNHIFGIRISVAVLHEYRFPILVDLDRGIRYNPCRTECFKCFRAPRIIGRVADLCYSDGRSNGIYVWGITDSSITGRKCHCGVRVFNSAE